MKYRRWALGVGFFILILGGASMDAFGFLGFGGTSWQEEVLLHDGGKIIVERSADRGGRHEIGQQPPIKEQHLIFAMPATGERITWKSEYSKDVGLADFTPISLGIVQGAAYVVSSPVGCLSYNKWGRPNPPYIIFKHQNKEWRQITMQELPPEIQTPNLIISSPDNAVERIGKRLVPADDVSKLNNRLTQPEYKTILREPLDPKKIACKEMIRAEDGWLGIDWFSNQPSYEACLKICEREKVSPQNCPCARIFNKNNGGNNHGNTI